MKRHLRAAEGVFIITILITFLVCPVLYSAEETLPTPEEIIAKNIEAIGGINALKKIKNKKIVQIHKYDQTNMVIKETIYQERPNNFYRVMDSGDRVGSNGKMAWEVNHHSGPRLFEGEVLLQILRMTLFDNVGEPDMPYKSMKSEGIEQINGKDCYKVVKTPEKGPESTVYYDKNTYMIVKTANVHPRGNNKYEVYNEDYRKINGLLFPYKVVTFVDGQKGSETTIEKIELNIEMPEGIFDIPEEVKAIMDKK